MFRFGRFFYNKVLLFYQRSVVHRDLDVYRLKILFNENSVKTLKLAFTKSWLNIETISFHHWYSGQLRITTVFTIPFCYLKLSLGGSSTLRNILHLVFESRPGFHRYRLINDELSLTSCPILVWMCSSTFQLTTVGISLAKDKEIR